MKSVLGSVLYGEGSIATHDGCGLNRGGMVGLVFEVVVAVGAIAMMASSSLDSVGVLGVVVCASEVLFGIIVRIVPRVSFILLSGVSKFSTPMGIVDR